MALDSQKTLTLGEAVYEYIVPRFWPKTSSFRLPNQRYSSSNDSAKELFKDSDRSASLLVCTRKENFCIVVADFLSVTA